MFSFHKPKIYRSLHGCCICRAKSSSSRFTDSKRYECDFEQCFGIDEHRAGEICNACVLLVKRWKKLPAESSRNWHHVVDARAGPGTKSMYKIKNRNNKELPEDHSIMKKKHKHKHKRQRPRLANGQMQKGGSYEDIAGDEGFSDNYSRSPSPGNSDASDDEETTSQSSSTPCKRKQSNPLRFSSMIDLSYWKKTETCCGIIFKGLNGEVIVDPQLLHPCRTCKIFQPRKPLTRSQSKAQVPSAPDSCASSDSGVSTPLVEQDDEFSSYGRATPPPPTLEPEMQRGELPPQHLVPLAYTDADDITDNDDKFMPPVMPLFLEGSRSASMSQLDNLTLVAEEAFSRSEDDSSCSSVDMMSSEAAAAAVLDLSMAMSRNRFIPMHV